MRDDMGLK